jgi:ferredoxin
MIEKILEKQKIIPLLNEAKRFWEVYAPQKYEGGDVLFTQLTEDKMDETNGLGSLALGDNETITSPKEIFFPQNETLFIIESGRLEETIDKTPKLLFGIKACDLNGILFTDNFFKRNYEDIYYLYRALNRFIIVIGCLTPPRPDSCFCTSTHTGPFAERGYDLQLIDNNTYYFVDVGSSEGGKFVVQYSNFFKNAPYDAEKKVRMIKQEAAKNINLWVNFDKALNLFQNDDFIPEEIYKRIAERCIYCGACLYTCPTCTCFYIGDSLDTKKSGIRFRNWDGCVFEGYTREASGNNPRMEEWIRTSRRYEHKLKYDVRISGTSGCVGCGRCLESCPVNIGMSRFIQELTENKRFM